MDGEWRPIETAPRDGTPILVVVVPLTGHSPHVQIVSWSGGWYPYDRQPTHWQPLPSPPQENT